MDGVSLLSTLQDPATPELHDTQYFEMMGSRSIYHQGWKATTNHISTGVLDEEELAVGSRNFDDDRWELFDLSADFSEATDRADDEPERLERLRALWDAEAERNHVLPISDGLVDRFGGFIPPVWPAGTARTFRPGGGPVADESVPMLWGGFDITADIDTDREGAEGVVFALGDWFGGYALYLVGGRAHFTFARAADTLELAMPSALGGRTPHTRRRVLRRRGRGGGADGPARRRRGGRRPSRSRACCRWQCSTAAPDCVSAGTAASRCPRVTRRRPPSEERCTRSGWTRRAPPGPGSTDEVRAALHAD